MFTRFIPKTPVAVELYERFIKPDGRTVCAVADLCDLTCQQVVDLLYGRLNVTPEIAVALADGLDTSAEHWLKLQGVI
jgi:plasmid maintenance system antidote protein VapI